MAEARTRILVAEDDTELRSLIAAKLRASGYDVVEASDGEALLGRLADAASVDGKAIGYDMIVSDVRMPHFTALDVLVGARKLLCDTPVLLITAFGDEKFRERARRLGATDVLDKPIRIAELGARVSRLLSGRNTGERHPGAK